MDGVSVIICCHNSESRLPGVLEHLQAQREIYFGWEVIVVDNASDDNTSAVAKSIWDSNPVTKLKILKESKPGLMNARLLGMSHANFEFCSFIDDDNLVNHYWIKLVYECMREHPECAAVGGKSIAKFESGPPSWFSEFDYTFAVGTQGPESGYYPEDKGFLWGAGLNVRKSIWDKIFQIGFKPFLIGRNGKTLTAGEDSELCLAFLICGHRLYYDERLTLVHFMPAVRLTEETILRMHKGFGRSEIILSLYRHVLRNEKINLSWLWKLFVTIKDKFLFILKTRQKSIRRRASLEIYKGMIEELLLLKSDYRSAFHTIKKYKLLCGKVNTESIKSSPTPESNFKQ